MELQKQVIRDKFSDRKQRLINGKRTYTNKIRLNELNYILKEILGDEESDIKNN